MPKSNASKTRLAPGVIVAERVMAHHERGGFSSGEARRNYLSGGGVPLHAVAELQHIGKVREGAPRRGEYGGTCPSEATRAAQARPLAGRASLPPITPDDVLCNAERGCAYDDKGNLVQQGGLFTTRDGRVVRTTHMEDKPLPRLRTNTRTPATRVVEDDARIAAVAKKLGVPLTARNRQHILDYIARKDAGIVRG